MSKTVFTNGCFDIIHPGHVGLLAFCRSLAGVDGRVVVAVNSDSSVRRLKGSGRPVNTLDSRVRVLYAMKNVDWVFPFNEDTPIDVIKFIRPDIIVKGGDYSPSGVVGYGLASVEIYKYDDAFSTSKIIEKIRSAK